MTEGTDKKVGAIVWTDHLSREGLTPLFVTQVAKSGELLPNVGWIRHD